MKHLLVLLLISIILNSCSKPSNNSPNNPTNGTFKYEVHLSKGTWSGSYVDANSTSVQIIDADSVWSYTGKVPDNGAFYMYLFVRPQNYNFAYGVQTILNLYHNDSLVRTFTFTTSSANQQIPIDYQINP